MGIKGLSPGIKPKLLVAFGAVMLTTLIASTIALLCYDRLEQSLNTITSKNVPLMVESMELSQLVDDVGSRTSLLVRSNNIAEANDEYEAIISAFEKTETILQDKINRDINAIESRRDLELLSDRRKNVEELFSLVKQQVSKREALVKTAEVASAELITTDLLLRDIVDAETSSFERSAKRISQQSSAALKIVLKKYLTPMVSAIKIDVEVRSLTHLLRQSLVETSLENLKNLEVQANDAIKTINDHDRKVDKTRLEHADAYYKVLSRLKELSVGDASIYEILASSPYSIEIEALIQELAKMEAEFGEFLAPMVDSIHSDVLRVGGTLNERVTVQIPTLMSDGVLKLVALLQMRIELNTIAGTLAQVPNINNNDGLKPLQERYHEAMEVIDNSLLNLSELKNISQTSESIEQIKTLAESNNGLFTLRQTEYILSTEISTIEQTLRQEQQTAFDKLVINVLASQSDVDSASSAVTDLIASSRMQLIAVAIASILTTIFIFWTLVSRYILSRLLTIITALRSLADGQFDVLVDSSGTDELADLARTVEVFRANAIKNQQLQAEQAEFERSRKQQEDKQLEAERRNQDERNQRHKQEQALAQEQQRVATELQSRVDALLAAVSAASQGNLNYPINTLGEDLAGQMGRALDQLFSELRLSMQGIDQNATQLTRASEKLNALSVNLHETAKSNAQSASEASELTNEVGSSVESVAGATEQMTSSIQEIARNTTEAEAVASEAVILAKTTDTSVRKLAESSAGIGSVIKVITSIAEQTNLLALNATIEAARAGDAGKGFAVVANEVKELAKETAMATEQIETRISEIQTDTDSAVNAIESIDNIISRISSIQSTIALAVDEQAKVTQEINKAVSQSASGSEAISSVIQTVASKAQTNQQASVDMGEAASDLSNTAGQLQQLVKRFANVS